MWVWSSCRNSGCRNSGCRNSGRLPETQWDWGSLNSNPLDLCASVIQFPAIFGSLAALCSSSLHVSGRPGLILATRIASESDVRWMRSDEYRHMPRTSSFHFTLILPRAGFPVSSMFMPSSGPRRQHQHIIYVVHLSSANTGATGRQDRRRRRRCRRT